MWENSANTVTFQLSLKKVVWWIVLCDVLTSPSSWKRWNSLQVSTHQLTASQTWCYALQYNKMLLPPVIPYKFDTTTRIFQYYFLLMKLPAQARLKSESLNWNIVQSFSLQTLRRCKVVEPGELWEVRMNLCTYVVYKILQEKIDKWWVNSIESSLIQVITNWRKFDWGMNGLFYSYKSVIFLGFHAAASLHPNYALSFMLGAWS